MTLTPKAKFLQSDQNISKHRNFVDQPEFERGTSTAMAQLAQALAFTNLSEEEKMIGAAGLKLRGAHEFLDILRNLSEKPKNIVPMTRPDTLNPIP